MHECQLLQPASSDAGIYRMNERKTVASEEESYINESGAVKR